MQSGMIGFLIGSIFTALAAYYFAQIFIRARVKAMISAETEKRIKDLEFDNCFLEKKLGILMSDNIRIIQERNEFANDISKQLKGL